MTIPDYQTIMLPLLKFMGDQKEHNVREMIDYLAGEFRLSDEEKRRLLPSGNDVKFDNKVKWSRLYLGKAGLLKSTGKGYWKISKSGLQVLSQNPSRIDVKFLGQLPEYQEFHLLNKSEHINQLDNEKSVEEQLEHINLLISEDKFKTGDERGAAYFEKYRLEKLIKDKITPI